MPGVESQGSNNYNSMMKPSQRGSEQETNRLKPPIAKGAHQPLPMSRMVISDIIYPVQTKKGLKWNKRRES